MYDKEVNRLKCPEEMIILLHEFLDGEIDPGNKKILRNHLQSCRECEILFNELNKTIAFIKSTSTMEAPDYFTKNVMERLLKKRKR